MTTKTKMTLTKKRPHLQNGGNRKNLHLIVDQAAFDRFKENCREARMDLSQVTELLWDLWDQGRISISTAVSVRVLDAPEN